MVSFTLTFRRRRETFIFSFMVSWSSTFAGCCFLARNLHTPDWREAKLTGCGDYRDITQAEGSADILQQPVLLGEREVLKKEACIFQTTVALYWCSGGKVVDDCLDFENSTCRHQTSVVAPCCCKCIAVENTGFMY